MAFYRHESIDQWPRKRVSGKRSQFDSKWSATVDLLHRELKHMRGVRWNTVVLKTFHGTNQVRNDGMLRADVTMPTYPGVILEFDVSEAQWYNNNNDYRTVTRKVQFICDTYNQWKDNVRAIALGMEALRSVERYGITSEKGEQYEGFKEKTLPPAVTLGASMTVADALAFIQHKAQKSFVATRDNYQELFKAAAQNCHPDRGGNHDDMARLNIARETLKAHFSRG